MSATMGHPPPPGAPPGNVVPFPQQQPPAPQMVPNPAYAQWQQLAQARAAIMAKNAANQQQFDEAIALIRKDGMMGFRLDVEADSTIAADEAQERDDRTQFMGALLPLLQQIMPIAQGNPAAAEFGKQLVMFGVRAFPVARTMEESIERAFDALAGMPPAQPKGAAGKAGPNPQVEGAKIQADVHDTDTKAQTDRMAILQKQQQAQQEFAAEQMRAQAEQAHDQTSLAIQASEAENRTSMMRQRTDARAAGGLV